MTDIEQGRPPAADDLNPPSAEGRRTHPIAHPMGSVVAPGVTSSDAAVGVLNDGAHRGATASASRRTRRGRGPTDLASLLSDRDIAILRSIDEHQFLTVHHIEALHFAEHAPESGARIARRTMARLRSHRLLGTLERRVGGVRAGSSGLVHYLDGVGDQLLHARSGRTARRRKVEPSSRFLSHRLAVADARIALTQAAAAKTLEVVDFAAEPASWRRYTGASGARMTLKPDATVTTAVPPGSDLVRDWFIEIDLGHEGLRTLIGKCRDYEAYRSSGVEQQRSGGFPVVVWCMSHRDPGNAERRRDALRRAIDADQSLPSRLFRIVTPEQLATLLSEGGMS